MIRVNNLVLDLEVGALRTPLSFALSPGQVLWVRGENGVGKSTLLKTLLGWVPATGEVRLNPKLGFAYLSHQTGLVSGFRVWEQAYYHPLCDATLSIAEVQARLREWGLERLLDQKVQYLSQGQKARLALAIIALSNANVWLLDEPFAALDLTAVQGIKKLLRAALSRGVAMIIVSHQSLEDMADHTLELGSLHGMA